MEPVRYFTPEEAAATLPRLRPLLAELRDAFHAFKFARDQLADLRKQYGEDVLSPAFPERREAERWRKESEAQGQRVEALVAEVTALGADVKDPLLGLVDFYARRGDGETVLLCYRDDEDALAWWHPLTTGFSGRRPLKEF